MRAVLASVVAVLGIGSVVSAQFGRKTAMIRAVTTVVAFLLSTAVVRADITVTMTSAVEMEGIPPIDRPPRIVMRIKENSMTIDVEVMDQRISAQVVHAERRLNVSLKPARRTQRILGRRCEASTFVIAGHPSGGARMITKGVVWTAKAGDGAVEYRAFQKRAVDLMLSAPPIPAFGLPGGDFEAFVALVSQIDGLPCRIEATTALDGKSEVVELLRLPIKVTSVLTSLEAPGTKD